VANRRQSEDGMVEEYSLVQPLYKRYSETCENLIAQFLGRMPIRVHSVSCREKALDKLAEKVRRPDKNYQKLGEVTDLAAVRVITFFEDDVQAVAAMINKEFTVLPEYSLDKSSQLDPDRFGYVSLHLVCRMSTRRTRLKEYEEFKGLLCEVQARSILQHAWAEIEHDLGYKSAAAVPRHLRRRFARLAALLETADEEFIRVRDDLSAYAQFVEEEIGEDPGQIGLDKLSLTAYVLENPTVRELDESIANLVGAILQPPNEGAMERSVGALASLGVSSIGALDEILRDRAGLVLRQCQERMKGDRYDTLDRGISVFHMWQVLAAETGDPGVLNAAWMTFGALPDDEWASQIVELIKKLKGASTGA
jgi:putative GTP pyrophosphokinase